MESDRAPARRARLLLALGASAGLAAAAASLISPVDRATGELPDAAVARVNGAPIRRDMYLRALDALASDRREPLDEGDRRRVLDRLIDEELLVQHALSLGLARHDRQVRADLVSAVMGSILASTDGYEPSPEELASFYRDHADYFTVPGRLRVRQVFVGVGAGRPEADARRRADEVARRLRAGEEIGALREALGERELAPLPDLLLPAAKLRSLLGPTALRAVQALAVGDASDPVRSAQGYHVLQLVEREPPRVAPLAEIAPEVRSELLRRRGDRAIRERLDALRAGGRVEVAEALP